MFGRLLRVTGTVLVIAVAFVTPVLATSSAPASADTVVNGCTIVSNPTPTNFTNCPGVDLSGSGLAGVNLSFANLAGANFIPADCTTAPSCGLYTLSGTTFTDANLSHAVFAAAGAVLDPTLGCPPRPVLACEAPVGAAIDMTGAKLSGADLSNAVLAASVPVPLGSATVFAVDLSGANLSGANLTGTSLVPSNQSVSATSQAGAVVNWPTPAAIPGAIPGSCTPASGSTFPLFNSTVTCQVTDGNGDVATGTFQVSVAPTTQYFARIGVPSNGAVLSGSTSYLDAAAGDGPGVTKVLYELNGGSLANQVIATGTLTYFGWLAKWDTTTVPNGSYSLTAVATDAAGNTDTSTPVSLSVDNAPPTTVVGLPANGATQSGDEYLDAGASAGVTSVTYELSGGSLSDQVISGSTPTLYGWIGGWNTASVPNGTYTLQSVACYSGGVCGTSAPITITVSN